MKSGPAMVDYQHYCDFPALEMKERARDFLDEMRHRRSIRDFSSRPVAREIIERCIRTAGTAPSGANMQPWHFVVVTNKKVKRRIRLAAEKEERAFYQSKAPREWLDALAPLGTDSSKPFLERAPCLIAIFQQRYGLTPSGGRVKHYYAPESVGLATGLLITSIHHAGLACLTHTPSPMGFLNDILKRPKRERPFLLLVVGHPAKNAQIPDISRKSLSKIATFVP